METIKALVVDDTIVYRKIVGDVISHRNLDERIFNAHLTIAIHCDDSRAAERVAGQADGDAEASWQAFQRRSPDRDTGRSSEGRDWR